jgi:putative PEP-CTERM system TPR-repeat lipoprotein
MPCRSVRPAVRVSLVFASLMLAAGLSGCEKSDTSAALLADAQQYQAKGDIQAALIQLKNAAFRSPQDPEVRLRLAQLYNLAGDPVSAEKEIRRAASLGMDSARTAPELVKALNAQGQAQKAIDESDIDKPSAELLAGRGDAWLALNKPAKAQESFEQALAAQPGYAEALIGKARVAALNKDLDSAIGFTNEAAAANPKDASVPFFKARLLRAQGKPQEALATFGEAIKLKPDHINARIERAVLEIGAKDFAAAKADIDAVQKFAPTSPMAMFAQGLLEFTQADYPAARESLQKVLSAVPDHLPSILLLGSTLAVMGSWEQAEMHTRFYLASFPNNKYALKLLAQIQLKNRQPLDAAATLSPLLTDGTQDPQLLALAGESSMRSGDFAKARQYFEKASSLAPQTATLHTSLGLSKLGQGDQQGGIAELEQATALDPASESTAAALVGTEMSLKHYDKALAAVQKLIAAQPQSAAARNLEGGVYIGKGDRAAARASFEKAASLQADLLAPVRNLALMDVQEKQPDAARQRLAAFIAKNQRNTDAMVTLAQLEMSQNRPDDSRAWLEKAYAANPQAVGPARMLAAHYLRTKDAGKALTLLRKVQTEHPADAEVLDLLGQAQLATSNAQAALETYSKLVNVQPKSADPHLRLSAVHAKLENLPAAEAELKKALSIDPSSLPARYAQLDLALMKGPTDEALTLARKTQEVAPKAAEPVILEGTILAAQKKPDAAFKAYERAFTLAQTPLLAVRLAASMKALGKARESEARLQQWQKEHGSDPVIVTYMGESALMDKQYKTAAALFESLLKTNPDNAAVLNNLALAYQAQKDPRALATAERAMKLAPTNAGVIDTVGWMLAQQGDLQRAVPLLRKAVEAEPRATETRYHLAYALNQAGDKKAARQELDKLLADNKEFPQLDDAKSLLKAL